MPMGRVNGLGTWSSSLSDFWRVLKPGSVGGRWIATGGGVCASGGGGGGLEVNFVGGGDGGDDGLFDIEA